MSRSWAAGAPAVLVAGADDGSRTFPEAERLLERLADAVAEIVGEGALQPAWTSTHVVPAAGHGSGHGSGHEAGTGHVAVAASWQLPGGVDADEVAARLRPRGPSRAGVRMQVCAADGSGRSLVDPASRDADAAGRALLEHVRGSSGRVVRFPGSTELPASVTVAELVRTSAVDDVEALAGTTLCPGSVLHLDGHVRPRLTASRCVLLVQRTRAGLVPFEVREQRACCTAH